MLTGGKTAKDVYNNDLIIKETIKNIENKEKDIIDNYTNLINFKKVANKNIMPHIDKVLNKQILYLKYKTETKKNQCNALLKLLEYINTLNAKDKEIQHEIILDKIKNLEYEIKPYNILLLK